jgi:hypothetical protein
MSFQRTVGEWMKMTRSCQQMNNKVIRRPSWKAQKQHHHKCVYRMISRMKLINITVATAKRIVMMIVSRCLRLDRMIFPSPELHRVFLQM